MTASAELLERALLVLTLRGGFNANSVLLGTLLLGIAAGVVGSFLVLRGRALVSDAMSHATLPGIVLAFLAAVALGGPTRSLPVLLGGAAATGVLGVGLVQVLTRYTRLTEDAAIGAVLSVGFGLGVVLLSYAQTLSVGGQAGLAHFILGQAAAMSRDEALAIGGLALATVAATLLFRKELALLCFNPEFAGSLGWPVAGLDLLLSALVALVVVTGLQTVGLVLIVALLIIPAAAARLWTARLGTMLLLAGAIGGASAFLGSALSFVAPDLPTGSVIVLTAGMFFVASLLAAPERGAISALVRLGRERLALAETAWLASLAGHGRAPHLSRAGRLWLRLRRLTDARGAPSPRAEALAPEAARRLASWESSLGAGRGAAAAAESGQGALP